MKLKEPIDYIRTVLSSGPVSDEFRISDRLAYHIYKVIRAKMLKEREDKYHFLGNDSFQTTCMTLTCDDKSFVSGYSTLALLSGEFPDIVIGRNGYVIQALQTAAGENVDLSTYRASSRNKYGYHRSKRPFAYFKAGELFIQGSNKLKKLYITAVFADPADAYLNDCSSNDACKYALDADAAIPHEMLEGLYKMTYGDLAQVFFSMPEDVLNDARQVMIKAEK